MTATILVSQPYDRATVRPTVEALYACELDFFWQGDGGTVAELATARCVVLFWSAAAIEDQQALDLGARASEAGKAIHALIEPVTLPARFESDAQFDLSAFDGNKSSLQLHDLLDAARAKAKGIAPAPQTSLLARLRKRSTLLYLAIIAPALAIVGHLADIVSFGGWFDGPSSAEAADLKSVEKGSCKSLRQFYDRHQNGYYAERVFRVLTNPAKVPDAGEILSIYPTAVSVPAQDARFEKSEIAAREAARTRADKAAPAACEKLLRDPKDRLIAFARTTEESAWGCAHFAQGHRCGFVATVRCTISAPKTGFKDVCTFESDAQHK